MEKDPFPTHPRTGIVVPTLGKRLSYLGECLESIKQSGNAYVSIVIQADKTEILEIFRGLIDMVIEDPGVGLADAINAGIRELPSSIKYCSWLGDDDLLEPGSLEHCERLLDTNSEVMMVFGQCKYITSDGQTIGINKSGQWAVPLLRFGPCLVPQPGSLFRRKAFEQIGGLDSNFGWAFDFDLLFRFKKLGKLIHVKKILGSFRWHSESLSVSQRHNSVVEASLIRKRNLPNILRSISTLWEFPVKFLTLIAGRLITRRASKISKFS